MRSILATAGFLLFMVSTALLSGCAPNPAAATYQSEFRRDDGAVVKFNQYVIVTEDKDRVISIYKTGNPEGAQNDVCVSGPATFKIYACNDVAAINGATLYAYSCNTVQAGKGSTVYAYACNRIRQDRAESVQIFGAAQEPGNNIPVPAQTTPATPSDASTPQDSNQNDTNQPPNQ